MIETVIRRIVSYAPSPFRCTIYRTVVYRSTTLDAVIKLHDPFQR